MVWDARGHVSQPLHLSVSVSSMETGVASTSPVMGSDEVITVYMGSVKI